MNSRRTVLTVLVLAAAVAVWWFGRPTSPPPAQTPVPNAALGEGKSAPAPVAKSAETVGTPATQPNATQPNAKSPIGVSKPAQPSTLPASDAAAAPPKRTVYVPPDPVPPATFNDLQSTSRMLSDYRQIMGENPVGTNAEIMKSLMGGNKKGAILGPPEGMQLNSNGELVDRWGTPIFFHALAKDHMEIRSAGPDHVMWTKDDVILK